MVDLSHTIREGMATYPGLPGPRIRTHVGRDEARAQLRGEASFHIGFIELVANTGTYLDTPFHFHERGADCATADVGRMVDLACVVVDVRGQRTIGPEMLPEGPLTGAAVLFRTDRSSLFGKPEYAVDSPFLTRPLVEALVGRGRRSSVSTHSTWTTWTTRPVLLTACCCVRGSSSSST